MNLVGHGESVSDDIMWCNVCGWCGAFTKTERMLSVLQALLLAAFIGCIIFLILHLMTCNNPECHDDVTTEKTTTTSSVTSVTAADNCTWIPSQKTTTERYYLNRTSDQTSGMYDNYVYQLKHADGSHVLCILTAISRHWVITTATCLTNITIESHIITDKESNTYRIGTVILHPLWELRCCNLAGIRTTRPLLTDGATVLSDLAYLLLTLGDTFTTAGDFEGHLCQARRRKVVCETRGRRHLVPLRQTHASLGLCTKDAHEGPYSCDTMEGSPLMRKQEIVAIADDEGTNTPIPWLRKWIHHIQIR